MRGRRSVQPAFVRVVAARRGGTRVGRPHKPVEPFHRGAESCSADPRLDLEGLVLDSASAHEKRSVFA